VRGAAGNRRPYRDLLPHSSLHSYLASSFKPHPAIPRQHVLNNSAQSLIFESFIPRRSLGLEMGGGCSAAAGAVAAESIAGGLGHG